MNYIIYLLSQSSSQSIQSSSQDHFSPIHVEIRFGELLRQHSYAIKNQQEMVLVRGIGHLELVLYGIRMQA